MSYPPNPYGPGPNQGGYGPPQGPPSGQQPPWGQQWGAPSGPPHPGAPWPAPGAPNQGQHGQHQQSANAPWPLPLDSDTGQTQLGRPAHARSSASAAHPPSASRPTGGPAAPDQMGQQFGGQQFGQPPYAQQPGGPGTGPVPGGPAPTTPVPEPRDREPRFVEPELPVCTTDTVPGREVSDVLGPVFGVATRPRNMRLPEAGDASSDASRSLRAVVVECRQQAVAELVEMAIAAGADAVVGVRFDGGELSQGVLEVSAYGTAVTLVGGGDHQRAEGGRRAQSDQHQDSPSTQGQGPSQAVPAHQESAAPVHQESAVPAHQESAVPRAENPFTGGN